MNKYTRQIFFIIFAINNRLVPRETFRKLLGGNQGLYNRIEQYRTACSPYLKPRLATRAYNKLKATATNAQTLPNLCPYIVLNP